jgi:hypothetical protein
MELTLKNNKKKKKKKTQKAYIKTIFFRSFSKTKINMEKLLQWAVNNTDNASLAEQAAAIRRGEAQPDPKRYDPKILEAILGKDDATRMKGKKKKKANQAKKKSTLFDLLLIISH